ncbi:hypothetical protein [Pseudomonas sp. KU43P]|uniref:hypothetical protein n=1 Tax=Pseudomonas sp. KU43P TaxID=2487887 RepID=UPI0012A9A9DF|nr:hypothetical protein [Pseudomonas sp. KU43P]BBH45826.1 hypothetical protein KU43P_23030 [Pseudomonas sp. KU43P]
MQHTTSQTPATGELVGSFRYGKAFKVFMVIFSLGLIALAGFMLYLGSTLPASGPVSLTSSRGTTLNFSDPATLTYFTSGLLVFFALALLGLYAWHSRMRKGSYELYENGIAHTLHGERTYVPFTEIEDLYLFSSGQAAFTGLITNLAYRRNPGEPFNRVIEALKGFHHFQHQFRELYLNARQPQVWNTLQAGGTVTFNCIENAEVWRKRVSGNFLDVQTQPLVLSRDYLQVQGRQISIAALRSMDHSNWTEKVTIKDAAGNVVFSTISTGILSTDLFLNTLGLLMEAPAEDPSQAATSLA